MPVYDISIDKDDNLYVGTFQADNNFESSKKGLFLYETENGYYYTYKKPINIRRAGEGMHVSVAFDNDGLIYIAKNKVTQYKEGALFVYDSNGNLVGQRSIGSMADIEVVGNKLFIIKHKHLPTYNNRFYKETKEIKVLNIEKNILY